MKVKTRVDKINELLKVQVVSDDSDAEDSNNIARIENFDEDEYEIPKSTGESEFRKKNAKLLSDQSARYKGKITTRKELRTDDSQSENSQTYEESSEDENQDDDGEDDDDGDEEKGSDGEDSLEESEFNESDSENDVSESNEVDKNSEVLAEHRQSEILKGNCVQNQLRIWERLLELRIHTQKLLNKSNQLPSPNNVTETLFKSDLATKMTKDTYKLLQSLLMLQSNLTSQFSELKSHMKHHPTESLLPTEYETEKPPLKRIALELEGQHNQFRSYRNTVLIKWDDRTKLLTPGAGAKRKMHEDFDVVQKIENALLNRGTLIRKSQSIYKPDATPENNSFKGKDQISIDDKPTVQNSNVYDDSDFYHQQLRELIEYKTNNSSTAADVTKQLLELQTLRQKMKKPVDNRASKGRKIRYIVHKKLVNFMAPEDTTYNNWTDESKDELYKSLFAT